MKISTWLFITFNAFSFLNAAFAQIKPSSSKTEILLFGSTHFGQQMFYKQGAAMDMFSSERQKEISAINAQLEAYHPDLILIEREASEQPETDSLYHLYKGGKLKLTDLEYGRAEQYQFAFQIAKHLNLSRIYGANYYTGLSTNLFKEGKNLDQFKEGLTAYGTLGRSIDQQLKDGQISLKNYLLKLNELATYQLTYYTLFIRPAVVRDGSFGKLDSTVNAELISKDYIGAEYISLFYNRELKIFSNILLLQQQLKSKRILLIFGQRHAAVLSKLFAEMPDYKVVPMSAYIK